MDRTPIALIEDRGIDHRLEWSAMGSTAVVEMIGGSADLIGRARWFVNHLEQRWSRFRPDSDISRLNAARGRAVPVDPATRLLLRRMLEGVALTGGAFDPTLLAPLVGLGYGPAPADPGPQRRHLTASGVALQVGVDEVRGTARLPLGTWLDAGAIGKGLAADLTAEWLIAHGATTAMVNLGGDLRLAGSPRSGWRVDVDDPRRGGRLASLVLDGGGVATSGVTHRRWNVDGAPVHHVLDPHTSRPVTIDRSAVIQATVAVDQACWAEVLATEMIVRGAAHLDVLDGRGVAVCAVLADGKVRTTTAWQQLAAGA